MWPRNVSGVDGICCKCWVLAAFLSNFGWIIVAELNLTKGWYNLAWLCFLAKEWSVQVCVFCLVKENGGRQNLYLGNQNNTITSLSIFSLEYIKLNTSERFIFRYCKSQKERCLTHGTRLSASSLLTRT